MAKVYSKGFTRFWDSKIIYDQSILFSLFRGLGADEKLAFDILALRCCSTTETTPGVHHSNEP